MKKKKAIKLIKESLPSCIHAVLLKDKKHGYTIATGRGCVAYQLETNHNNVKRIYSLVSLDGSKKFKMTKM